LKFQNFHSMKNLIHMKARKTYMKTKLLILLVLVLLNVIPLILIRLHYNRKYKDK
jgi:hypothetical protein